MVGPHLFLSWRCHTKGFLEGITEVNTDPKGRFVSFKVTPSNDRVLCVYPHSGYNTREQLVRGRFQNYMGKKNEGNENKVILGDFWRFYPLWIKWKINHNGFLNIVQIMPCQNSSWIRENPDSPEFTRYENFKPEIKPIIENLQHENL